MECSVWQRETQDGRCIEKWWAGPPATWLVSGAVYALGTAVFVLVLEQIQKSKAGRMLALDRLKVATGATPNRRKPGRRRRRRG